MNEAAARYFGIKKSFKVKGYQLAAYQLMIGYRRILVIDVTVRLRRTLTPIYGSITI